MFSLSLKCRNVSKRLGSCGNDLMGKFLEPSMNYSNPVGRGAGKGGGAGGSVRESGGGIGEYGAAQEEMFFYNKQKEQIEKMKKKLKEGEGVQQKPEIK